MSNDDKINIEITDEDENKPQNSGDLKSPTDAENETRLNENETSGETEEDAATELEKAKEDAKQSFDRYLRVSAEFENYKKRMTRETDEFKKYANESLISALLPVIDNLERAIISAKDDSGNAESLIQGIELTLNEILNVFSKYHVEPIESIGKPFDPNFHQAMLQEETDKHPDNTIIQELQRGYTIHNRLLRPAMVVVSKTTDK